MDGMQMLLKAFGLNADDLKRTANDWMQQAQTTINYFVKRHDAHDTALARVESKLDLVLSERLDYVAAIDYIEPSANRRWTNVETPVVGPN